MKHLQSRQVWAYLDGELEPDEQIQYDRHIAACIDCRRRFDDIRVLWRTMGRVMQDAVPAASTDFHSNLLVALSQNVSGRTHRPKKRGRGLSRGLTVGLSSAAAVVVAAGVGWYALHGTLPSRGSGLPNGVAVGTTVTNSPTSHPRSTTSSAVTPRHGSKGVSGTGTAAGNTTQTGSISLETPGLTALTGQASLTVTDNSGTPISNAHVAFVADGSIVGETTTNADGQTDAVRLMVPVDPVLQPVFSEPGFSQQGVMTVVVWKQGYRPLVSYDVRVFQGGLNQFSQSVTLTSATSSDPQPVESGYGFQDGTSSYHILLQSAYVNWVKTAVNNRGSVTVNAVKAENGLSTRASTNPNPAGQIDVTVVDENGHPVSNAHVAVVAGSRISGSAVTNSSGSAPQIATSGIADWRFIGPWNIGNLSPRTAAVVVWKKGYAAALGMYVPLSTSNPTTLTVKLDSLAWRKSQNWNNLDSPSAILPQRLPSKANAAAYVDWVSGQGY